MSVMLADSEIELYVNDEGKVSCHLGCDDWVPAYDMRGRRCTLEELVDVIRMHAHLEHSRD